MVWADSAAISLTPNAGDIFNNGYGYSLGYEFTLSQAVTVDDLGYFDDGGLTESRHRGQGSLRVRSDHVLDKFGSDIRYRLLLTVVVAGFSDNYGD